MELRWSVPVTYVLHIGAGFGGDVASYYDADITTIALIEADPEAAAHLRSLAARQPGLQVVQAAVSADTTAREFHRTSFPDLNSLSRPKALLELFPGLHIVSAEVVDPVDPVTLMTQLDLPEDGKGLLVIEAPGESMGILQALDTAGLLSRFEAIRIQEGREALYHDAVPVGDILKHLSELGFVSAFEATPDDPDRPHVIACRDRVKSDALTTIVDLTEALRENSENAQKAAAEAQEAAEADKQKLIAGKEAEMTAAQEAAEADKQKLIAEKIDVLEKLEDAQRDTSAALRMQILHDADLKHLQGQYAVLLDEKNAQDRLLESLTASLGSAAKYLQEMEAFPVNRLSENPPSPKRSPARKRAKKSSTNE